MKMYIDKTYPFEPVSCPNFHLLNSCLGEKSLAIHYNDIYLPSIRQLNEIISRYPNLQNSSLDELIFNNEHITINEKKQLHHLASKVYNHHVFFSSINKEPCNNINLPVINEISKWFGSLDLFKQKFFTIAKATNNGFVYLVSDENLRLSIFVTDSCNTPIPYNLYPLMCIDMWEHSYYLTFLTNKEQYINNYLNVLNWNYINNEFLECQKCIL
jgi:Fe-Mn family superoxide dismutase